MRPILSRLRSFSDPKGKKEDEHENGSNSEPTTPKKKEKLKKITEDETTTTVTVEEDLDEANPCADPDAEEEYCTGACDSDGEYDLVDEDGDTVGSPKKHKFKKNVYKWMSITFSGLSMGSIAPDSNPSPRGATSPNLNSQYVPQRRRSTIDNFPYK
ncbi:hypothetical protein CYY_004993 [Polysphondylium violaceum]|uniref:Uncharacterized protein n=1 Tax=Polysphondylium violaceum TaxID=133409 RepID=A0A8J4PUA3_9MYCE|nr:hypothetical protein CYY_004993 [Polysphondylium violaceum]